MDWRALMGAGMTRAELGGLGLTPAAFWALTPAELALMLGEGRAPRPMDRDRFQALAARFPDAKDT